MKNYYDGRGSISQFQAKKKDNLIDDCKLQIKRLKEKGALCAGMTSHQIKEKILGLDKLSKEEQLVDIVSTLRMNISPSLHPESICEGVKSKQYQSMWG